MPWQILRAPALVWIVSRPLVTSLPTVETWAELAKQEQLCTSRIFRSNFSVAMEIVSEKKALNLIEISQSRCWVPIQFLSSLALPLLPQHKNDNGFDRCGSTHLEHSIYLEKDRTLSPPQEKLEKMKDCALWKYLNPEDWFPMVYYGSNYEG